MTQDQVKRIHRWYSWILATVLTVSGLLLIGSCLDIYTSGPRPYSVEAIALRFQRISVAVFISVAGIAGGICLNLLLPVEPQRTKSASSPETIMLRLRLKADIPPVQKEIRLRHTVRAVTALCYIVLMIYPLIYLLTPHRFSVSNLNTDVIRAVWVVLIPTIGALMLCWICQKLVNNSFMRESSIYKEALAAGKRASSPPITKQSKTCNCRFLRCIQVSIIALALVLIILGVFNGGADDVLKKAIAICTECIGLG